MDEANEVPVTVAPELTPRQRSATKMLTALADDLDRGTLAEQRTAALLRLAADAVGHGYDGELGRAVREWAAAREAAPSEWVDGWEKWNAEQGQ